MMGHKICLNGKIWKIIPKLSLLPLLIWSTDLCFCKTQYGTPTYFFAVGLQSISEGFVKVPYLFGYKTGVSPLQNDYK